MELLLLFLGSFLYLINQFVKNFMVTLFFGVKNLSDFVLSIGIYLTPKSLKFSIFLIDSLLVS